VHTLPAHRTPGTAALRSSFVFATAIVVAVSVVAAPALAADPAASATPPVVAPGEPWIVYEWEADGALSSREPKAAHLVRADGSDAHTVVVQDGAWVLHPDWSPDGERITYDIDFKTIWTADADGSDSQVVVSCEAPCDQVAYPAWSPNGTRIAYSRFDLHDGIYTDGAIEVVDLATGARSKVVETRAPDFPEYARWAPDGQRMVLQLSHYPDDTPITVEGEQPGMVGSTIVVADLQDARAATLHPITPDDIWASYPDWNPVQDLIVFGTYDLGAFNGTDEPSNLSTVRPDGSDLTQITSFGPGEDRAVQPSWTPDGTRVIFAWATGVTGGMDYPATVGLVDADGGDLTRGLPAADPIHVTHPRLRPTP
jgi:Tol biopolymer transport system component